MVVPLQKVGSYVLRTRPPLGIAPPLDLHVLGTPPTFVLSQDQTRQLNPARWLSPSALASHFFQTSLSTHSSLPAFAGCLFHPVFKEPRYPSCCPLSRAATGRERGSSNLAPRVNRFLPLPVAFFDHHANLGLGRPARSHSTSLFRRGSIALMFALI